MPRARRLPAWLVPVGIFTGFGLLFAGLYRDRLLPATAVEVAAVLVSSKAAQAIPAVSGETAPSALAPAPSAPALVAGGAPLFQASGWIEPDPYPIKVPALIDGVVAEVLVLEGQAVEKGQLLARLVDDDAKLALAAAEGRHTLLESARRTHLAAYEATGKKREAAQAEAAAAQTLEAEAGQLLLRSERLVKNGAVSELDAISARLRAQREKSLHQAAQAREGELAAEVRRMEHETQAREDEIALAAVAVEQARLALQRTLIHAPVAGRVLRLAAAPGDKKMLSMDHPDSSTICLLYEPDKLQVRVDVPLADAAQVQPGQRVKIHTSLLAGQAFDGEVTRVTGEADLQRNTLQAKVRLHHPSAQLRPEMLCRVEFFGGAASASGAGGASRAATASASPSSALTLWVPAAALQGGSVWVCDPETKRLSQRVVRAASDTRETYRRVLEGLRPGEQAVLTTGGWREGQRVRPTLVQP